jgi:UPF0716 family protein affecting phage T7 exclusion
LLRHNMKRSYISFEHGLYLLAFIVALGVRLLRLGFAPLSDFEAQWALQALQVASGEGATIGPQPGYILLCGLVFFILGSSDFLARLWPAIAGSLLVWLPWFFRSRLGQKAALILAFGLALDPGLVALSRLAGGPMFALGFGLLALASTLALGLIEARQPVWAGIFGGLALLGGPAVWHGAAGLGLAYGLWRLLSRQRGSNNVQETEASPPRARTVHPGVLAAAGVILLIGTLFGVYPQGLSAWVGTLPAYLQGWTVGGGTPVSRLLAALVLYQPLALVFGLKGAVEGWMRGALLPRVVSVWGLSAFVLAMIYPARGAGDLVWVLVPLWVLAALELAQHLKVQTEERLPAFGQAALILVLLALAWMNFSALSRFAAGSEDNRLRWAVIFGALLLGGVTTVLVALGWSKRAAGRGLVWGVGAALGLYGLSAMVGATLLRPNGVGELWYPSPATTIQESKLLLRTLDDLAVWRTGHRKTLDVVVLSPSPALRWALRDWHTVRFVSDLQAVGAPEVIITPADRTELKMAMAYRGQDFAWREAPGWGGGLPPAWEGWLAFREAPLQKEGLILWARSDLFPGQELTVIEPAAPMEEEPAVPGQ